MLFSDSMVSNLLLIAILTLVAGGAVFCLIAAFRTYLRYRGDRVVTCPQSKEPATVHVKLSSAAISSMFGKPAVRLDECSRWPERQHCGQGCLAEIDLAGQNCLVRNMVNNWYKGKTCAYCQKPFDELHWHNPAPALLGPNHTCVQWNEVRPEQLAQIFETYLPVCWNCYIAETYRRKFPHRVTNRNWERGAGGEYVPKETGTEVQTKTESK